MITTEMSQLFKVLSDETRLSILLLLFECHECNVSTIVQKLGKEQSAISHQLQILRRHHLVKTRREGKVIYYTLDDEHVSMILATTKEHISHRHHD